jgi:uncharacterized protein
MPLNCFSVILSPTYRCNADCEYCFEDKTSDVMEVQDLELIFQRLTTYLRQQEVTDLKLYWQGGEVFTMKPEWFLRAHEIVRKWGEASGITIDNAMQSNLIGFSPRWCGVVSEMFGSQIGSSLDFPNLYRKVVGGTPETYNETWRRRYQEAKEAGIHVGVIAVLHAASMNIGADAFYEYYVDTVGLKRVQINTPHPGGPSTPAKRGFPLDNDLLSAFYSDLFAIWMRKGRSQGVEINPFHDLVDYFRTRESYLGCIWGENCANTFLGIGPKGNVGQCECFVSSFPDHVFGNILTCQDMADIMNSPVRKQFLERPERLMEGEDCSECEFLAVCHGGCPIHAYSTTGDLFTKDPNCQANKVLFRLAQNAAVQIDRLESTGRVDSHADSSS